MNNHNTKNLLTAITAMLPVWIIAIIVSLLFSECANDNQANMPRRKAYPRVEIHDSTFTTLVNSPVFFEISTSATVTLDSVNTGKEIGKNSRWFNFSYPKYNAVIYCTFTPVDKNTINEVIQNRTERMKLNSGDLESELTEMTNSNGFKSQILFTIESQTTPIQFISTDYDDWVVSGALYLNDKGPNTDSILPIINTIKRDIIHSLKTIKK